MRQRPIFKNWEGFLTVRETKEAALGCFGSLELLPPYDEEDDRGEGFFNVDDNKKNYLGTKEVIQFLILLLISIFT